MSNRRSEHSIDQTKRFMDAYERLMEQFADGGRLDWPAVLNRFEGALLPVFDADGVSILIGSPEPMTAGQDAFLRAYTSGRLASNPQGAAIPFQQAPWLEAALESKTPLNVKDRAKQIEPAGAFFDRELSAVGARSALAAPFESHGGGLVGAAALYRTEPDAFSEEHERLIAKLSPLIQTILSAAYDYNERRLGMLRTEIIHEVNAEAVAQLTSPEQLYDRVCELIHQRFELYDVAIFQIDWGAGDAGEMSLAGHSGEYFEYHEKNYTQSAAIGNLGYAARTGQTRLVNDAQNDPIYFNAFPANQTIRSELTIPIKTEGGYVTAVMDVQSQESYAFDKYQVASLEALSRLVASIVQSVDWYKQMGMLHRLGQQLRHTLDLKSLYHAILTCVTAGPGFGFNRAILFMLDEENAALEEKLHIGPASTEEAYRIWSEIGEQTIEEYLDHAPRQIPFQDVSVADRFMRIPVDNRDIAELSELGGAVAAQDGTAGCSVVQAFQQILRAEEFALIPLVARRRLIGVIIADNSITGQPIAPRLLETLGAFASQAALALSNAQTYRKLEIAFEELESAKDQAHRHERQAIVGQLMQYVTHEIRNPLVSIGGFARRIRKTTREKETIRRAGIIAQETTRLEIILKDVMDFMSPLSLDYEPISLEALAKEMIGMIAESAAESKVHIVYECPEPLPDAHLDVDWMKQTLWNLSKNAVEAMPNGGVLTIRLGVEGDYVRIEIEDTGTGIQSDHIDRLFEPFYTTKKYGSGLGLALTKQIIDHHGGSIEARSELNHGTAFTIRLPINRHARKGAK